MLSINCHFRLPTDFTNLDTLVGGGDLKPTVDIYCINLQQIVYRGKTTLFKSNVE